MVLKPLQGEPGTLTVVFVPLPDLRDKGCTRCKLLEKSEDVGPIHITVIDLKTFSINSGGIGKMEMGCERKDSFQEV